MRYGSVCSGIEAATVAWHPLGWQPAWFAEIEKFPCAVLAHHYPSVPNLGDMTTIAERIRAGVIEAPDILVGGTPCQAFSVAGARAGLADPRGQLTLAYVDLADAIDSARALLGKPPVITVWENVPGVLSSKDNAFGCFLGALAGESSELQPPGGKWKDTGCVYGPQRAIAWRVLDAQYFGLAQRRRRVFVVASARARFDPAAVLFEREGVRRDTAPRRGQGQDFTAGTLRSTDGGSDVDHARANHLITGPLMSGGKTAGSATNQDAESGLLVVHGAQDPDIRIDQAHTLGRNSGQENAVLAFSCKDYGNDVTSELSPTLRAMGHGDSHANAGGQVAVAFVQNSRDEVRLMGGDGQIIGALAAEAGMKQQCYVAQCVTGDITHTLKADGFDGSEDGTGRRQPIVACREVAGTITSNYGKQVDNSNTSLGPNVVASTSAVRRLTPRECERLQGFKDNYTLVPFGRAILPEKFDADYAKYLMRGGNMTYEQCLQAAADGPRYKAIGNSKAVPVVNWLGRRIDRAVKAMAIANDNQKISQEAV